VLDRFRRKLGFAPATITPIMIKILLLGTRSCPVDKDEGRLHFYNTVMLPKSVIACLAAIAFATSAIMSTGAAVAGRGGIMEGTWNWPPYAGSGGGMPGKTTCGYVWVNPHRHKPGKGQWVYQCH
jgi:hypothetical protein